MSIKRLFLLCCLTPTLFFLNSCSTDIDTEIAEIEELSAINFLQVDIGKETFVADKITVNLEGSLINIVGTDTETNRSVFLTFVIKGDTFVLGDPSENPNGNFGGYLINDTNEGYLSNAVDGIAGEIKLTDFDRAKSTISGKFFFTAYNQDYIPIELTNGVFQNILMDN